MKSELRGWDRDSCNLSIRFDYHRGLELYLKKTRFFMCIWYFSNKSDSYIRYFLFMINQNWCVKETTNIRSLLTATLPQLMWSGGQQPKQLLTSSSSSSSSSSSGSEPKLVKVTDTYNGTSSKTVFTSGQRVKAFEADNPSTRWRSAWKFLLPKSHTSQQKGDLSHLWNDQIWSFNFNNMTNWIQISTYKIYTWHFWYKFFIMSHMIAHLPNHC